MKFVSISPQRKIRENSCKLGGGGRRGEGRGGRKWKRGQRGVSRGKGMKERGKKGIKESTVNKQGTITKLTSRLQFIYLFNFID